MWVGSENLSDVDLQEIEREKREKEAFATALLHWPKDPMRAAMSIEPYNSSRAVWIAQMWLEDPYVKAHQAKLLTDISQLLPSKVQIAHEAMKVVHDPFASWDQKLKALRLCSDLQGWTGPGVNANVVTNNQVGVTNRVMEVPVMVDQNQWEARAVKQQEMLTTTYSFVEEKDA